jgi:hypothetical protein
MTTVGPANAGPTVSNVLRHHKVEIVRRYAKQVHLSRVAERLRSLLNSDEGLGADERAEPAPGCRIEFRLSVEDRAELARAYCAGLTVAELQERFGLGKEVVRRVLAEGGVTMRRQPLTATQVLQAKELYAAGLSVRQVATKLGMAKTTVREALVAAGVEMRAARRVPHRTILRPGEKWVSDEAGVRTVRERTSPRMART